MQNYYARQFTALVSPRTPVARTASLNIPNPFTHPVSSPNTAFRSTSTHTPTASSSVSPSIPSPGSSTLSAPAGPVTNGMGRHKGPPSAPASVALAALFDEGQEGEDGKRQYMC